MTKRSRPRLLARVLCLLALSLGTLAALAVGAEPASASVCATDGHAYLTKSGRAYFSGYEGNQQFGIPTFNTYQGDTFKLGANGIRPYSFVTFSATDPVTGAVLDNASFFLDGQSSYSLQVGTNCVANEQQFTVRAPDGRYRITARYFAGDDGNTWIDNDQVVDVVISNANRPRPGGGGGGGGGGCLAICPL